MRSRPWLFCCLLLPLAGCPDPKGKFDQFAQREDSLDLASNKPDGPVGMFADISGTFLLGTATSVSPSQPLQFIMHNTVTANGDGTGSLDCDIQALTVTTRMPVGNKVMLTGQHIGADGKLNLDLGTVMVPGAANPITGQDITGMLKLVGVVVSADRYCGDLQGMITAPLMIDLMGSTWAAIRVPASGVLPQPVTSCGG